MLGDALGPLATRLQGDQALETLAELGLRVPVGSGGVAQGLQESATACSQLPGAVADLIAAAGGSDDGAIIAAAIHLGELIVRAGVAFAELGTALDGVIQGNGGLSGAQKARMRAIVDELPDRLLHLALIAYVEDRQPSVKGALELAGLFDDELIPADPADPSLPAHRRRQVRLDRLGSLVSDPAAHLADLYGFGTAGFDGVELFTRIKQMVDQPDAEALLILAPGLPAVLEAWFFRMEVVPGSPPALSIRIRVPAQKDLDVSTPLAGVWSATVTSSARFEGGIELVLHPTNGLRIEPPSANASLVMAFGVKAERGDGSPIIILGSAGGSRLELQRFALSFPLSLSASTGSPSPTVDVGAAARARRWQGRDRRRRRPTASSPR